MSGFLRGSIFFRATELDPWPSPVRAKFYNPGNEIALFFQLHNSLAKPEKDIRFGLHSSIDDNDFLACFCADAEDIVHIEHLTFHKRPPLLENMNFVAVHDNIAAVVTASVNFGIASTHSLFVELPAYIQPSDTECSVRFKHMRLRLLLVFTK